MASDLRWDDLNFVRELGDGQAGHVWLATVKRAAGGLSTDEQVAVKRYKRWVLQEPGQYERVFRELAASVKIRHPHVVQNICLVTDSDTLPALVMRYYDGKTLESVLAELRSNHDRLPIAEAFQLLGALIDAVAALHAARIYHRDIKPANILVENNSGSPILMDLGVVSDFLLAEQTQTTNFLGTIRYAEPGYLKGVRFKATSDWYSLGLVGYELFFAKRFLASEEQWARLVARKLSRRLPSKDDLAKNYQELTELSGQNAAEAVFHTLRTLLTNSTPQSLHRLRDAISADFWTKPFFEQIDGELVPGEPPTVPAFRFEGAYGGGPDHSPAGSQESLKTAHLRVSGILSGRDEPVLLPGFLKTNYWKWKVSGMDDIYDLNAKHIEIFSIYAGGGGDDTTYDQIYINAGVMALHRYGYL